MERGDIERGLMWRFPLSPSLSASQREVFLVRPPQSTRPGASRCHWSQVYARVARMRWTCGCACSSSAWATSRTRIPHARWRNPARPMERRVGLYVALSAP